MPVSSFYMSVYWQALPLLVLYQYVASKVCQQPHLTAGCRIMKVCKCGYWYRTLVGTEGIEDSGGRLWRKRCCLCLTFFCCTFHSFYWLVWYSQQYWINIALPPPRSLVQSWTWVTVCEEPQWMFASVCIAWVLAMDWHSIQSVFYPHIWAGWSIYWWMNK